MLRDYRKRGTVEKTSLALQREERGNAALTEMVPIITEVHLRCVVELPGIR